MNESYQPKIESSTINNLLFNFSPAKWKVWDFSRSHSQLQPQIRPFFPSRSHQIQEPDPLLRRTHLQREKN